MPLDYIKGLWCKVGNGKFGIIFVKNEKKEKILTKKIPIFNMWCETLRKLILVSDFHSEYQMIKQIGSGSFARVIFNP